MQANTKIKKQARKLRVDMIENELRVIVHTQGKHAQGWLQHHIAKAIVDYANANPELGLASMSAEEISLTKPQRVLL